MRLVNGVLVEGEAAKPEAGAGEVVVRVRAAGVTPTEVEWYPTTHTKTGEARAGAVLSHEFSGVVEAVGEGVTGITAGEAVFGMNDWFAEGALAEYCVTRPEWIAAKPKGVSDAEAAATPIGALTAWQGLFDRARLRAGERVLVHGGAGAVGVFAVQLARRGRERGRRRRRRGGTSNSCGSWGQRRCSTTEGGRGRR
jgi:NADPH:quinone reductase-like Zn-dependent oxidoreductase